MEARDLVVGTGGWGVIVVDLFYCECEIGFRFV